MNRSIAGLIIIVVALLICFWWPKAPSTARATQATSKGPMGEAEAPSFQAHVEGPQTVLLPESEPIAQPSAGEQVEKLEKIEAFLTKSRVREDLARFAAMYRGWLDEAYDRAETDKKREFIDTHRAQYSEDYIVAEYVKLLDSTFSVEQMDKLNAIFDDSLMRGILDAEHDDSLAHQERWSAYELEAKDFQGDRRKALRKLALAKVAAEDALDMHRDIVIRSPANNPFSDSRTERLDHYLRYYAMSLDGYDNEKLGEIAQAMSDETYLAEKSLLRDHMLGILQPNAYDLFGP